MNKRPHIDEWCQYDLSELLDNVRAEVYHARDDQGRHNGAIDIKAVYTHANDEWIDLAPVVLDLVDPRQCNTFPRRLSERDRTVSRLFQTIRPVVHLAEASQRIQAAAILQLRVLHRRSVELRDNRLGDLAAECFP